MSEINDVIQRMISACGVKNSSQLAEVLGLSQSATSQWKRRKIIPEGIAAKVATLTGTNLQWILSGDGERFSSENNLPHVTGLDSDLLRQIIESIEIALIELEIQLKPSKKADLIVTLYAMSHEGPKFDRATLLRLVKLAS